MYRPSGVRVGGAGWHCSQLTPCPFAKTGIACAGFGAAMLTHTSTLSDAQRRKPLRTLRWFNIFRHQPDRSGTALAERQMANPAYRRSAGPGIVKIRDRGESPRPRPDAFGAPYRLRPQPVLNLGWRRERQTVSYRLRRSSARRAWRHRHRRARSRRRGTRFPASRRVPGARRRNVRPERVLLHPG